MAESEDSSASRSRGSRKRRHYQSIDIANATMEELALMNPSLMTERQQLAFLLRQTAPPKAPVESEEDESSSFGEEEEEQEQEQEQERKQEPDEIKKDKIKTTKTRTTIKKNRKSSILKDNGCAMCGDEHSIETLFLCHECDQKYPTQKALGRV